MASEYFQKVYSFVERLKKQQGSEDIYVVSGRKFDRIVMHGKVRYFVSKEKGDIYGIKSEKAPNLRHWYGTVYRCHLWNWSGPFGVPVDDSDVRTVSSYGAYHKYVSA